MTETDAVHDGIKFELPRRAQLRGRVEAGRHERAQVVRQLERVEQSSDVLVRVSTACDINSDKIFYGPR